MIGWFRKKEPVRPISEADNLLMLSDTAFADVVVRTFRGVIPAGHAMIVVAFQNMGPMLAALRSEAQRKGQAFDVDELIRESFKRLNSSKDDEIKVRRWGWLLFSLQLHRLMQRAADNHSLRGKVVEIWAMLASSGQYLKQLLEHNIVWSEQEKVWFANLKDANEGVEHVVNWMVPKSYRSDPTFHELAKRYGFFVNWISRTLWEDDEAVEQFNLGVMYANGHGVAQDYAEAVKWYRKAAEQGFARAQYNLGVMYYTGQRVAQDYAEAVKWYRKAAEQGNANAQNELGRMYYNGQGVPQDYAEAVKWFRNAANQSDVLAQTRLGVMYTNGEGVAKDYAEAASWYRKAADQGDAQAEDNLGLMYVNGRGVRQEYAEAVKWFRKAAEQGDAFAQSHIGSMYSNGLGVAQDYVQAHMWFSLAAARYTASQTEDRNLAVSNRDAVATKMTPAQIAEAQRLASEWRPKHQ